jgi:hypothetical protein
MIKSKASQNNSAVCGSDVIQPCCLLSPPLHHPSRVFNVHSRRGKNRSRSVPLPLPLPLPLPPAPAPSRSRSPARALPEPQSSPHASRPRSRAARPRSLPARPDLRCTHRAAALRPRPTALPGPCTRPYTRPCIREPPPATRHGHGDSPRRALRCQVPLGGCFPNPGHRTRQHRQRVADPAKRRSARQRPRHAPAVKPGPHRLPLR